MEVPRLWPRLSEESLVSLFSFGVLREFVWLLSFLVGVSIPVKKHHYHDNFCNGKHLIVAGLPFQRFIPLSS